MSVPSRMQCSIAPFRRGGAPRDDGFTLVETMVALGVIFTVLIGLLASLDTGTRGLLTGRQRTGATAVAKEVVETARAADYDDLGHDVAGDTTLATDPRVTGTAGNYQYQPEGVSTPEDLVSGGADPTYPSHQWDDARDGSTYTIRVYVTKVQPTVGDVHKRLTVAVSWDNPQYGTTVVANEVVVSTYVSQFGVAATARVSGVVDVDTGAVTITGTLSGMSLSSAKLFFPLVHADVAGNLLAEAHGYAGSSQSELVLTSGTPSGCDTEGSTATCDGVKAETVADNDGGSAPCFQDVAGPTPHAGGTTSSDSALSLILGSTGSVTSRSSAESSTTLCGLSVGDGDGLLYADEVANGPGSMSSAFDSGLVEGSLVDVNSAGSSTCRIDADAVAADQKVVSTGRLVVPAVELVTLSPALSGFTSAVSVGAVDVTATAEAGPTASSPSVSGDVIAVQVYDTVLGEPTYRTINVTPGENKDETAGASYAVGGGLQPVTEVTLETTVHSGEASLDETSSDGTITEAEADLTNWFVVTVHLVIVEDGIIVADLTVELDYGRIVAEAGYTPA